MGCGCFCPSFSSSTKATHTHVYLSPLPKSRVSEAQLPGVAQPEIQQADIISNSISETQQESQISNGKKVHFSSKVTFIKDEENEEVRSELKSLEADSKQSSGEGGSYESLFSLQLVDGWSTPNEEEVMSKAISNSKNTSRDEEFTFPTVIQLKGQNEEEVNNTKSMSLLGVCNEERRAGSEEVSVDSSLSGWLVDTEPENTSNTPMSTTNDVKDSIYRKPSNVSEKRRVLGELSLIEVNGNFDKSLKNSNIAGRIGSYLNSKKHVTEDSDSYGSSIQNTKQEMRRHMPREDQNADIKKAIPLGMNLARAAIRTGMV